MKSVFPPLLFFVAACQSAPTEAELDAAVARVHADALVFDGHNDLPWALHAAGHGDLATLDLREAQPQFHTDIPRLRAGHLNAQFWSAYVPVESADPVAEFERQIALIHTMVERYPEHFEFARTADDVERIVAAGRIASLVGMEGGHGIVGSLDVLQDFYEKGVRYLTLTHANSLDWADSATDDPIAHGLSPFGESVIRKMNELGMLVDISHVSVETMRDVLRVTSAPVIASHSSAKAIAQHERNVPDDVLREIARNGGVVMVNFFSGFVVEEAARAMEPMFAVRRELRAQYGDDDAFAAAWSAWREENPIPRGDVHDVVDHIEHIIRVAGVDHVGLGSDYDGVSVLPEGLDDVSTYPVLTRELLRRGHSETDVRKILGGNALRALREAEAVAARSGD